MVAAITLTPDNGVVGATITIDGTGFSASEAITLTYGGAALTPVAPITTDGAGVFSGTFLVPTSVQGIHSVVATDVTLLTDDADFTVNSQIVITEANTTVGSTINVTGTGFDGVSLMAFTLNVVAIVPVGGAVTTDATGGFVTTFTVPALVNGSKDLIGTDAGANTDTDSVIIDALLVITEVSAVVGDTINFTGTGFAASELITFGFTGSSSTPVEDPISSDVNGGFVGSLIITALVTGNHTLTATDVTLNTDNDTILINPNLIITEANIIVGGTINFTGTGFSNGEAITFTFDGDAIVPVSPVTSNVTGGFTGSAVIPATPNGSRTLVATDVSTETDSDTVIVDAKITLSVASGDYGDSVTVTGTGFDASSSTTITFNAVDVTGAALSSDADGGFTRAITVPDAPFGARTVTATDAGAKTDSDTFTVAALITLDDGSGSIGETVVISGHGFAASSLVSFTFDSSAIIPTDAPITSASNGSFSASIVVPEGSDDTVTIVATDAATRTDSITFIIIEISGSEITLNTSFEHFNGLDLNNRDVGTGDSIERSAVIDIPFGASDVYTTGGVRVDFSGVQGFSQVYLCKVIHSSVGLVSSFIPGASNGASLGKIKFWGTNGNELADNDSSITSKSLQVEIRGI